MTIIACVQSVIMLLGFVFVVLQFRKQVQAVTKVHDWNRRKTSQQACYEFVESKTMEYWMEIREPIGLGGKKFDDLGDNEKKSLLYLLYYFENLGISIKNNILDEDIIFDYFGYIWPLCHQASEYFIAKDQKDRNDPMLYEHVVEYAKRFEAKDERLKEKRRESARIVGKDMITG